MADPKVPEIACLKSEGPDGLEDFGGQWRFAESLKALRKNLESGKNDECEIAGWIGLDTPEAIYKSMVTTNLIENLSTKPRQNLIDVLSAWGETLHVQCLNGKTVRDFRAREVAKASAQAAEPEISRNAPCPCGSGKKPCVFSPKT